MLRERCVSVSRGIRTEEAAAMTKRSSSSPRRT